jgi:outer membrane scaffolding protein for murein synthesis (MipA/OmpV family)
LKLHRRLALALTWLFLLSGSPAQAEELPLWEAGLGFSVLDFPDYRGSDERTTYVLPVPYAIYRGRYLRVDRDQVRGIFFENDRLSLHLSVSASVPVNSSKNSARAGMPDLDATVQIGPNLRVRMYENDDSHLKVDLRLPARAVIATDFQHTHNEGWIFEPRINFDWDHALGDHQWDLGFATGPVFGDKRYNNYYYGVAPEYATPQRPAYTAESGYGGMQATVAISRRYQRMWVGAFLRWDTVSDAVYQSSPLVRQNETLTAGIALVWRLKESKQRVDVDE